MGRFLVFLLIASGILGGIHFYLWVRLVRDTGLGPPWRTVATVALVVLGASLPLSFLLRRGLSGTAATVMFWPVFVWMGLMFLLFFLTGAADAAGLGVWVARRVAGAGPLDPERRLFLSRLSAALVTAVGLGLGAFAVRSGLARVGIRHVQVALPRFPRALDGLSIVQLTDVHIGPTIGRRFLEDVVRRTNALAPDVVAITGDLVDGSVEELREAVACLADLKARHGVYFVTGNHEYYLSDDQVSGADRWFRALEALGVKVLHNERVSIGTGDDSFDLAGVDDWSARSLGRGHGPDLPRALEGRDPGRALVLLAHQPKAIHEAAEHGVSLQLSGHTHGGQIWPWRYMVRLDQPFVAGLSRLKDTFIYVSRGTGYWGPPMRLAEPAEITRIVLTSDRTG